MNFCPIQNVKFYNHGKVTLVFLIGDNNSLICLDIKVGKLLLALNNEKRILDFDFDFIEGKLKILYLEEIRIIFMAVPIITK